MAKKDTFNSSIQSVDKAGFLKKVLIVIGVLAAIIAVLTVIHILMNPPAEEAPPEDAPAPALVPSDIRYYDPASEETYDTGIDYVLLNQSDGNSIRVENDGSVFEVDSAGRVLRMLTGEERDEAIRQALELGEIDSSVLIALGDLEMPEPESEELSEAEAQAAIEDEVEAMLQDQYGMSLDDFYSMLYDQGTTPSYFYGLVNDGADAGSLIRTAVQMAENSDDGGTDTTALASAMQATIEQEQAAEVENAPIQYPSWMEPIDMDSTMTAMMDSLGSAIQATNTGSTREQNRESVNRNEAEVEWLESQRNVEVTQGRIGPYDLVAGTVVPITIVTGINTDLPGEVVGLVRQNVYDTLTGRNILIPKGSRLMANYNNSVAFGQKSVQIAWNQLITPDGYVFTLPGFQGVTGEGYAGVQDKYNNHFWEILGGAFLGSIINISTGYVRDQATAADSLYGTGDVIELLTTGVIDETENIAEDWIERIIDQQPTITIRPGHQTQLLVNQTINLRRY